MRLNHLRNFVPREFVLACALLSLVAAASAQPPLSPPATDPVHEAAAMRQDRIEELEFLVRETTAENERLQMELRAARQEIERLQGIVNDLAAAQAALDELEAGQSEGPGAPTTGTDNSAQYPSEEDRIEAARRAATGVLGTLPAEPAYDPEAAAASFREARQLLLSAPLPEAQAAFGRYLEAYPTGDDAPDARYWLAFTMLGQGDYRNAAIAFADYLERHGEDPGPRNQAPAALLRLGISLAGVQMRDDACVAFRDAAAHPRASQTTRQQAAQEARRNGCPAA